MQNSINDILTNNRKQEIREKLQWDKEILSRQEYKIQFFLEKYRVSKNKISSG